MRNLPTLDGKIKDFNKFLDNMLLDWEDAEQLYKNWDEVSSDYRKTNNINFK